MSFRLARLRAGEWITAVGVVLMAVALFVLHWSGSRTGWNSTSVLRWWLLVTMLVGAGLVVTQARSRAPALPACLDVICTVLAVIAAVWTLVDSGWLELVAVLVVLVGAFAALRQEGILPEDGPAEVPVVRLPAA